MTEQVQHQVQQIQGLIEEQNKELQLLQRTMQNLIDGRQKLVEQENENDLVKKEFDVLESGAKVYKLLGSVLVAQNLKESQDNVEKRLEFIVREVKKVDDMVKDNQTKQAQKRQIMQKLQDQLQKIVQQFQAQYQQVQQK